MPFVRRGGTTLALAFVIALAAPNALAGGGGHAFGGAGIRLKRMSQLPLQRTFKDANGHEVALGRYFQKGRPVLMAFVYFRCPRLCPLVLGHLDWAVRQLSWDPGDQYEIVTISFDPSDTPTEAKLKKQMYVQRFGRRSARTGWHFLTGTRENVEAVAHAAGFYYKYDPSSRLFRHQAGIFFLTPDGKVSQCITGIGKHPQGYDPQQVKLSLITASNGQQGSILDKIVLWCCPYDPGTGRYTASVWNITRLLCGALLIGVALLVVPVWLRSRHRHVPSEEKPGS